MAKIGADGGALTNNKQKRFGNFTVSSEIIRALASVDRNNHYTIYTLDQWGSNTNNFVFRQLRPRLAWMSLGVSLQELIYPKDIFIALNQAIPLYTAAKIIALSHGLSFMYYPNLYPDSRQVMERQIKQIIKQASIIIVPSKKIKDNFNDIFDAGRKVKIVTLPFGIAQAFINKKPRFNKKHILLYVGMGHPIKNIPFLISAFSRLIEQPSYQHYKLLLVGVEDAFFKTLSIPLHLQGKILNIAHAEPKELLRLYNEAACLLAASLYESFNLPVLEALSQQTQVVALKNAVIPELQPYVNLAQNNVESFTETIKIALNTPKKINLSKLRHEFSWRQFAKSLVNLYAQI